MSKYFKDSEFKRCTPSCSISDMDEGFMALLDNIREAAGIPLVLTSAYRSKEWEEAHKRTVNSAHTRGKAVDIRCNTSANRLKIVRAAIGWGITRIGIGKNFVHIDNDPTLPQGVIWTYYE